MAAMEALRLYLNKHTPAEQEAFASRCGTSLSYLRKAISINQKLREGLVITIDRESDGEVTVDELRPDVDWAYLRARGARPRKDHRRRANRSSAFRGTVTRQ